MSKTSSKPQDNGLLPEASLEEPMEDVQMNQPETVKTKTAVRANPSRTKVPQEKKLLTVEQYLRRAAKELVVADLIRSLNGQKIMSFADWEKETTELLNRKIW